MPRKPTARIREHIDRDHVVSYSVRFRGRGYPAETIPLGRSDEGINRARAEHEVRLIASQVVSGTWSPTRRDELLAEHEREPERLLDPIRKALDREARRRR
jgi:hypothetical protein